MPGWEKHEKQAGNGENYNFGCRMERPIQAQRCLKKVQRCPAGETLPDVGGNLRDQADFLPLLGFGQAVALLGRGKTALWAEANLIA
jgi:hypothetical protein